MGRPSRRRSGVYRSWHHVKRNIAPFERYGTMFRLPARSAGVRDRRRTASRPAKRADARRNEQALLDAAAAVFVTSGVEAPVRDIAAGRASGWARSTATSRRGRTSSSPSTGTRSRPAPRPGRRCLASTRRPRTPRWRLDRPVRRLPRHQARAGRRAAVGQRQLRRPARLLPRPARARVHPAARAAAARRARSAPTWSAYELMRGVGNLCIGADSDPRYDARRLVELLIAGLRR